MIGINPIVARYTFLSVHIIDISRSICLYWNIPEWRFKASNGEICLYLDWSTTVKQLKNNIKTVLQRGRVLIDFFFIL